MADDFQPDQPTTEPTTPTGQSTPNQETTSTPEANTTFEQPKQNININTNETTDTMQPPAETKSPDTFSDSNNSSDFTPPPVSSPDTMQTEDPISTTPIMTPTTMPSVGKKKTSVWPWIILGVAVVLAIAVVIWLVIETQ